MKRFLTCMLLAFVPVTSAQSGDLDRIDGQISEGWCELASSELEGLLAGSSPHPRTLYLKAKCELMLGNLEEAQKWGEKSVKAAPDSAEYWAQLGTIKAFRIRRSPMKGITLGRSSRKDYEKAVELDPANLNALESMMMFRLYAPGIAGGDKDKARELAEQILAVDPAQGHMARAHIIRWADKDMDRARVQMQAAADASPDDPTVCYELGRRLLAEGHRDDGLNFYQLGAERDPDPVKGQLKLADIYLRLGKTDQARDEYGQVLALEPDNPEGLAGTALVQSALGNLDHATSLLRALLESVPDYHPARYHLARFYIAQDKNPEEAARLLDEYLAGSLNLYWPSRSNAHWQRALALEQLDRYREAWEAISLAMDIGPVNDDMKRDAQRLEFMGKD
jgi:tetratricopeptide (TPR) repeat protein